MPKQTAKINNWETQYIGDDEVLRGFVYDHPLFDDATWVRTSPIISKDYKNNTITTKNTIYTLISPYATGEEFKATAADLTALRTEYDKFKDDATLYAESVATEIYNKNAEIERLKAENVRLRTALEYYANDETYWYEAVMQDQGLIAQEALTPLPPKPEGEPDAE